MRPAIGADARASVNARAAFSSFRMFFVRRILATSVLMWLPGLLNHVREYARCVWK
jgi:hypothetical protein